MHAESRALSVAPEAQLPVACGYSAFSSNWRIRAEPLDADGAEIPSRSPISVDDTRGRRNSSASRAATSASYRSGVSPNGGSSPTIPE